MKFHRSASGLSNSHLFLGVDVVVYVEGGKRSFSMDEVAAGQYSASSADLKFWQGVFTIFLQDERKFQFRAIGSKSTALSIADHIVDKSISNVWIAMDRDYDNFHGRLRRAPGVLYTYGYSWESDVCITEVVEETFWGLVQIARGSVPVRDKIEELFARIYGQLRRVVFLDVILSYYGNSFFPRDKPESIFIQSPDGEPDLNRNQLHGLLTKLRETHQRPVLRKGEIDVEIPRDCVGCVIACLYYRVLQYLLKRHTTLGSVHRQIINNLIIEKFVSYLARIRTSNPHMHYAEQFSDLIDQSKKSMSKDKNLMQRILSFLLIRRLKVLF